MTSKPTCLSPCILSRLLLPPMFVIVLYSRRSSMASLEPLSRSNCMHHPHQGWSEEVAQSQASSACPGEWAITFEKIAQGSSSAVYTACPNAQCLMSVGYCEPANAGDEVAGGGSHAHVLMLC